jgi:hypothetical protein
MHPRDTRRVSASIPPELRPTLLALSMFADRDGFARPSRAKLAAELGRTERTIRRNLSGLERAGVILAVEGRAGGRGHSTLWQIVDKGGHAKGDIKGDIKGDTATLKGDTHVQPVNSLEFEECASARESEITAPELVPARIAELRSLLVST